MSTEIKCDRFSPLHPHQANEQEEHQEGPAQDGLAVHVSVAHGGHGDDEEVHTRPVGEFLIVVKLERIPGVFQLKSRVRKLGVVCE